MNKHFSTCLLIFVFLPSFINECYAWPPPPDIEVIPYKQHKPLSIFDTEKVEVYAGCYYGAPIDSWSWSLPSQGYDWERLDFSDHSYVKCRFGETGGFWFHVWGSNQGGSDYDNGIVYVFEMDLDISGVNDEDEVDPCGFICVNDDDDNNNGTPDKDETGTVNVEDDLVAISLSYLPSDLYPGYVELKIPYSNNNIKVWSSSNKGTKVIPDGSNYYKRWQLGSQPSTLYVEGFSAGDADLWLLYTTDGQNYPGDNKNHDPVKFTVVKVNIDAGLSEQNELSPGKYINVNWDDDDNDGWQPNDTPPNGSYTGDKNDTNIIGGDNDFRSFTVSISPQQTIVEEFPNSKVSITFPGNVKVWQTGTKKTVLGESSELLSGGQFVVENLPKLLYLEGVSGSSTFRDAELKATWLPKNFYDTVKVTVFEVDLTGLFGFGSQQGDNDKKHSTFGGSSDKNGKISWDDANADGTKGDMDTNCEYFHNCMECQGTVKPSGVTNQVQFDFQRDAWSKIWKKLNGGSWILSYNYTPWTPDDPINNDEDLTPSVNNNIYQIDGPGFGNKNRGPTWDYLAQIADLREWVMVSIDGNWYQYNTPQKLGA